MQKLLETDAFSGRRPVLWDAKEHEAVMEVVEAAQQYVHVGGTTRLMKAVTDYEALTNSDQLVTETVRSLLKIEGELESERGCREVP